MDYINSITGTKVTNKLNDEMKTNQELHPLTYAISLTGFLLQGTSKSTQRQISPSTI
jgi:hypothetical protein